MTVYDYWLLTPPDTHLTSAPPNDEHSAYHLYQSSTFDFTVQFSTAADAQVTQYTASTLLGASPTYTYTDGPTKDLIEFRYTGDVGGIDVDPGDVRTQLLNLGHQRLRPKE